MDRRNGGGRSFVKGHPGGPGRPPKSPEIKKMTAHTRQEIERVLNEALSLTHEELKELVKDPKTTVLHKMVYTICIKGIFLGDPSRLDFILNRLIGKVKEPDVDITIKLARMPTHEVIDLAKEAIEILSATPKQLEGAQG